MEPAAHLIFVAMLVVAAGCFWWASRADKLYAASEHWPQVDATITTSRISRSNKGQHHPVIHFNYVYRGLPYEGTKLSIVQQTMVQHKCREIVDRYPVGSKVKAYVDPEKPTYAFIERSESGAKTLRLVGAFFIVLTVGTWSVLMFA